jgi:hypothetical protein
VISSGKVQGNFHGREYFSPELAKKNSVPVCDYDSGRTMELEDIIHEDVSNFLDSVWMS